MTIRKDRHFLMSRDLTQVHVFFNSQFSILNLLRVYLEA